MSVMEYERSCILHCNILIGFSTRMIQIYSICDLYIVVNYAAVWWQTLKL